MKPEITLIITNWNGSDLLRECLPTVLKAVKFDHHHEYEVMVIDDCSTDNSLKILAKEFPEIRAEKTPKNLGFQEEGIQKQAVYKNGIYINNLMMSLLKSDYETLRININVLEC